MSYRTFDELFEIPLRNGLTKPKSVRGEGCKMINMGELFRYPRLKNVPMDKVPLNEQEKHSSMIKSGDLLFARQSLVLEGAGQCSIFVSDDEEVCFESHLIRCRLNKNIANPLFYFYFFSSKLGKQVIYSIVEQGAGAAGIRGSDLSKIVVPFPNMDTQNAIVNILDRLDSKVELNRQTNQTLEQIAQALFKSWFVDFEPTRAKIAAKEAGASPEEIERAAMCAISGKTPNQLAQLPPKIQQNLKTIAALFPDALVDSELGEIPAGWGAKPFGELLTKTIGGDWGADAPDEKHTQEVKILRGTDLPDVYNGTDDRVPIRYVDPKKFANRKLEAGDIVIEVSGGSKDQPTGRSLFLTDEIIFRLNAELEPASFCRLFRPIDLQTGLILGLHLQKIYAEGKTWLYQNQSTGISNFQTQVFLQKELVVVPPKFIATSFHGMVMPILSKMSSAESKRLSTLRDQLLPKLLSGELSPIDATEEIK